MCLEIATSLRETIFVSSIEQGMHFEVKRFQKVKEEQKKPNNITGIELELL